MPPAARASLASLAQGVLDRNRRGGWTCPADGFYPHQWLWDSCFVAIGLARYDPERAVSELQALCRGQWANGMFPHMIFADGVRDVGSRRIWQSHKFPDAPRDVETSCITQPPLMAIAAWHVATALAAPERRTFLEDLYPRIVEYHRWLYRERDSEDRGLVTLIHPWECGLDTTPPWMRALRHMQAPWWLRVSLRLHLARVARFFRRDTRFAPAAERTSDDDGLRMLVLVHRAKRHGFDLRAMPRATSVLIEDVAFNAMLAAANRSLAQIAGELGAALDGDLERSMRKTERAVEGLWDEESARYYSRDAVSGDAIRIPTVATFLPLWGGCPSKERAARLVELLRAGSGYWPPFPVPSVPTDVPQFDASRYWKGPTWVNMNWAIVQGLLVYGETEVANELRRRTLDMVERAGFSEYFSALTGGGFGADEFSWTAALVLDLLEQDA
jgi:Trehalase